MIFKKKKKNREKLLSEFGKVKNDSYDFELIEKYFRKNGQPNTFHVLSDKTCNDLDFDELFMFLDRTTSKVGQQFLYNKLRAFPSNSNEMKSHEELIEKFLKNQDFRASIQEQLSKLNEVDSYYITSLFQDEYLKPPKWFFVIRLLSFTSLFSLIMVFFEPGVFFIILGVFISNIVIHYWNKRNLYQYLLSLPQLLRLNNIAKVLFENGNLKRINPNLSKSIKIIDNTRKQIAFFGVESKLQNDTGVLFWGIFEFVKILFLLEPLFFFNVLNRLDTKRKEIAELYAFIGQIDSLISIASVRNGLEYFCCPNITNKQNTIVAEEIYHPLIVDCVSNSIHVNRKSILLTGSNMSGKTSFIRTIGINLITGLTLNTCFAKTFSAPLMKLYSAIRISDDLMNDKSYYFEEVLTIKEMIDMSENGNPNLFLLDEIFKGTNTVERISAGKAVLSALNKSDNIVFVSTHDIELADFLKDEYELYHFSERVDKNTVDFDYKLKNGKLKNRNAIKILQINNYPENIISEAIEISKELDKITVSGMH